MEWEVLWQQWWLELSVAVASGLIVASFVSKAVRGKFWHPIGRVLRWPVTLRLTTTRRQRALSAELTKLREDSKLTEERFREVCDLLDVRPLMRNSTIVRERIERLQGASEAAQAHAQAQIEATQELAKKQVADQTRRGNEQVETAHERGRAEGLAEAMAEIEAQRAAPRLRPVWRAVELAGGVFQLANTQVGVDPSDISDVSLEVPMNDFMFDGSNQWPGDFPGNITFSGQRVGNGRRFGVRLIVRWRDGNGEHRQGEALIDTEPRRAVVL